MRVVAAIELEETIFYRQVNQQVGNRFDDGTIGCFTLAQGIFNNLALMECCLQGLCPLFDLLLQGGIEMLQILIEFCLLDGDRQMYRNLL